MAAARAMAAAQVKRKAAAVAQSPLAVGGHHQEGDHVTNISDEPPLDDTPERTEDGSRATKNAKVNNTVVSTLHHWNTFLG